MKKEIYIIKRNFGIEISENDFYLWLFFHELGHTFGGSGKIHAGAKVTDKTVTQEYKKQQEEIAKKYCAKLYRNWKNSLRRVRRGG